MTELHSSKRMRPQERIRQLVEIAAREIDQQNHLPVHYARLAEQADVTPQLVYKYFTADNELYINIVDNHLDLLDNYLGETFEPELAIARYCEFLADHGCAMSIILAHPHICTKLPRPIATRFHRLLRRYSRSVKACTQAYQRQCLLFVLSAASIPEGFLRLHRTDKLSINLARKYSIEMVRRGMATL